LPVRVRTDELGVLTAVSAMRGQLAELLEHEHAPLAVAQGASGVSSETPLFTSLFNYRHNTGHGIEESWGVEGVRTLLTHDRTNYPLSVAVDDDGHGIGLAVDAVAPIDGHLVAALVSTAAESLVGALEAALAAGSDLPLSAVDVLGEAERRQLLVEWNDTAVEVPVGT
ncbi:hypothetical protein, partial [Kitasatospora kifunensis]